MVARIRRRQRHDAVAAAAADVAVHESVGGYGCKIAG